MVKYNGYTVWSCSTSLFANWNICDVVFTRLASSPACEYLRAWVDRVPSSGIVVVLYAVPGPARRQKRSGVVGYPWIVCRPVQTVEGVGLSSKGL